MNCQVRESGDSPVKDVKTVLDPPLFICKLQERIDDPPVETPVISDISTVIDTFDVSILIGAIVGYKGGTYAKTVPVFTLDVALPISLKAVTLN